MLFDNRGHVLLSQAMSIVFMLHLRSALHIERTAADDAVCSLLNLHGHVLNTSFVQISEGVPAPSSNRIYVHTYIIP